MSDTEEIAHRLADIGAKLAEIRRKIQALQPKTTDGARTQAELVQNMGQAITNVNQAGLYVDDIV